MKSEVMTGFAARLAEALQAVHLDTAQSFWASNPEADKCPELQRAMLEMIQAERLRRDGTEIAGYPLPAFDAWGAGSMLMAGGMIVGVTEVAALSGEPGIINLSFRVLQYWLAGLTAGLTEAGV